MNSSFEDARSPFRSSSIPLSPANGLLDGSTPPRIVQKQVLHLRAGPRGCNVVLYLRLSLPSSSKTSSYPLFSDEGVKLKSSVVYPVEITKGNRTVITPDASQGLKVASRILGLDGVKRDQNGSEVSAGSTSEGGKISAKAKETRPRITSSQFHITVVCPPLVKVEHDLQGKSSFVAVVQYEVSLLLAPPRWPFVVSVPIPRCLNNKLHFVSEEDDQNSKKGDSLTVEFDPPLVHRPQPRARKSDEGSIFDAGGDETRTMDDDDDSDAAVVGPFPATNTLVVRWANVQAGRGESPTSSPGRYPMRAEAINGKMVVQALERSEDMGSARITVEMVLSIKGASYPALDKTTALPLAFSPSHGAKWVPNTLNVRCNRSRTLQSWSTKEEETSVLSRSSSLNTFAPSASFPDMQSSTLLGMKNTEAAVEDEDNLVNIQPPKGVADISMSFDDSVDSASNAAMPALSIANPIDRSRKTSGASIKSLASVYSQQSLHAPSDSLQLVFRTAAIREARLDSDADIVINLSGVIEVPCTNDGLVATNSIALLPALLAHGVNMQTSVFIADAHLSLLNKDGEMYDSASAGVVHEKGMSVKAGPASEDGDITGDTSAATALPSLRSLAHDDGFSSPRQYSDDPADTRTISATSPPNDINGGIHRVEDWSGVVEQAHMTVWMSNVESYTHASRKATYKLRMSWPRALPQSDRTSTPLSSITLALPVPRKRGHEDISILHASIDGSPVFANVRTENVKRGEASSIIVEIVKPESHNEGQIDNCTLLYSVNLEADGMFYLFAPIGSTVVHLRAELFDDTIQDSVAIITYTHEPSSSVLRHNRDSSVATLDTTMLPSMSSILVDYAPRTKPLVPLLGLSGAPISRRLTGSGTPLRNDVQLPLPSTRDPSFPSSPSGQTMTFAAISKSPTLSAPPMLQSKSHARKEIVSPPVRLIGFSYLAGFASAIVLAIVLMDIYGTLRSIARAMDVDMSHERWLQTSKELMIRQDTSLATIVARPLHFLAWLTNCLISLVTLPIRMLTGQ